MVKHPLGEEIRGFLSKGRLRFDSSCCTKDKIKLVTSCIVHNLRDTDHTQTVKSSNKR